MKALALFSGGLDSLLAALLIEKLGIEVIPVYFKSPFFNPHNALKMSKYLKNELYIIDFTENIINLIKKPKYGFGKNLNPCIDCHGNMLKVLKEYLTKLNANFIITGEVLGQRPMSQRKFGLDKVLQESTISDLVLRPLSAKLLEPTKPELEGWVDRNKLLDIQGRNRKRQILLAEEFGISDYPSPTGGCLLTDPQFCVRLNDLINNEGIDNILDINLLKYGRHFRINKNNKIIIGRNDEDNKELFSINNSHYMSIIIKNIPGPLGIITGEYNDEILKIAGSILIYYSKYKNLKNIELLYGYQYNKKDIIIADSANEEFIKNHLIL